MVKKQLNFFAVADDLAGCFYQEELTRAYSLVEAGFFDTKPSVEKLEWDRVSERFFSPNGDAVRDPRYLIVPKDAAIIVEEIPQKKGGVKYLLDHKGNPESLIVKPGGRFKEEAVIAGELGYGMESAVSKELFKLVSKQMKREFKKVKSYFVGPQALACFENGLRLTSSIKSPPEFDLAV